MSATAATLRHTAGCCFPLCAKCEFYSRRSLFCTKKWCQTSPLQWINFKTIIKIHTVNNLWVFIMILCVRPADQCESRNCAARTLTRIIRIPGLLTHESLHGCPLAGGLNINWKCRLFNIYLDSCFFFSGKCGIMNNILVNRIIRILLSTRNPKSVFSVVRHP